MSRHLSVLIGEHANILHNGLIAAIDGNGYALEIASLRSTIIAIVTHGEVLQIEACTVAQVEDGVRDTTAVAMQYDTIAALADERYIIARDALLYSTEVIVAILDEDGLAGCCSSAV